MAYFLFDDHPARSSGYTPSLKITINKRMLNFQNATAGLSGATIHNSNIKVKAMAGALININVLELKSFSH